MTIDVIALDGSDGVQTLTSMRTGLSNNISPDVLDAMRQLVDTVIRGNMREK